MLCLSAGGQHPCDCGRADHAPPAHSDQLLCDVPGRGRLVGGVVRDAARHRLPSHG